MRRTTRDERQAIEERLRTLLRREDPAAGDALTTEEIRAMRRTTLTAAEPAARRRPWLVAAGPALAAALVLLAAVALWRVLPAWRQAAHGADGGGARAALKAGGEEAGRVAVEARRVAERSSPERHPERVAIATQPRHARRPDTLRAAQPGGVRRNRGALGEAASDRSPARLADPRRDPELQSQPLFPTEPLFGPLETTAVTQLVAGALEAAAASHPPAAPGSQVASAPAASVAAPGLHLEFSTPGGTRILWTLTSPSES